MAYRCFECNKEIDPSKVQKKIRCIYCGSKIIYKDRSEPTTVKAR